MEKDLKLSRFKLWFNHDFYKRLFGVGPACFLGTGLLVLLLCKVEKALEMQTYYLTGGWFWIPFLLLLTEAVFILVWAILSLPIKQRGKKLSTRGVYSFVRHPIYTTIVFHFNILCSLWLGSYILLISIPAQYLLWSKAVVFEEQYLVGIFGQEYLDYMSRVSRFLPWR